MVTFAGPTNRSESSTDIAESSEINLRPGADRRPLQSVEADRNSESSTPVAGGDGESLFHPGLHEFRCEALKEQSLHIQRGDVFIIDQSEGEPVTEMVMNVNRQESSVILDVVRVDPSEKVSVEVRILPVEEFDALQPDYHVSETDEMFQQLFSLYKEIFRPNLEKLQQAAAAAGDPSLN